MGVQGLWQVLESTASPVTLESLEGRRLAVDISLWLHQAKNGYLGREGEVRSPHVVLLINRISKLLFYKIRPVFVFDGDQVPIFKRHVLRDRQLQKHIENFVVNKTQKKIIAEAVASQQAVRRSTDDEDSQPGPSGSKKPRMGIVDDDIMMLPDDQPLRLKPRKACIHIDDQFLAGYSDILSRDDRIAFLAAAKTKIKKTKLNDDDVPTDADEFTQFQRDRILQRVKIDAEIEAVRQETMNKAAWMKEGQKLKMVVVDPHARAHLLEDHANDVITLDADSESAPSTSAVVKPEPETKTSKNVSWEAFMDKVRQQKARKEAEKKAEDAAADDDDDVAQVMQAIDREEDSSRHQTARGEESDRVAYGLSKSDVVQSFVDKVNAAKSSAVDEGIGDGSSDSDDFEEVPLTFPADDTPDRESQQPAVQIRGRQRRPWPANDDVIVISDDDDGDDVDDDSNFRYAGLVTADAAAVPPPVEAAPSREDEKGVYSECQKLLTALGLPWLVAPGEAEAQCVELERNKLVDGVVTDDSDVWLFGGHRVYKNMFSRRQNVHFYDSSEITRKLGLSKFEFVQLTMLAGGDYTRGFDGVGMVAALELCAEFKGRRAVRTPEQAFERLEAIGEWLRSKKAFVPTEQHRHFRESATRIRIRKVIEGANDDDRIQQFPNKEVFDAYVHPNVSSDSRTFRWGRVAFDELSDLVWNTAGLSASEIEKKTHGAFKIWDTFMAQNTQSYQTRISAFTKRLPDPVVLDDVHRFAPTKRIQVALAKFSKNAQAESLADAESSQGQVRTVQGAGPRRGTEVVTASDSDDDFFDDEINAEIAAQAAAATTATVARPVEEEVTAATLRPNFGDGDSDDEENSRSGGW